jgi:hypothetical protein
MNRERVLELLLADGVNAVEAAGFAGVEVPEKYGVASVTTIDTFTFEDYRLLQSLYREERLEKGCDLTVKEKSNLRDRVRNSRCKWTDEAPIRTGGIYPREAPGFSA